MPKANFQVNLQGLQKLQKLHAGGRIEKKLALSLGEATTRLHNELRFAVKRDYAIRDDLDSVLVNRTTSTVKTGRNLIEAGLSYRYKPRDLSKFPFTWVWGNINPATREGRVHSVTVRRGKTKIVFGKSHHGGFVPGAGPEFKPVRFGRFGLQMFERRSKDPNDLRLLLGPSLAEMARSVLKRRSPKTKKFTKVFRDSLNEYINESLS